MIALILAAALATSPGHHCYGCGSYGKTYTNAAGHIVRRPVRADNPPATSTGRCADGYWTFAEQKQGACQGHGGVAAWIGPH